MQDLIHYFANISDEARGIFLVSGLAFFFFLETGIPLFRMEYSRSKHALVNIVFTLITMVVNLSGAALILAAITFNESRGTGFLNMVELPFWLHIFTGLIFLDLIGSWFIHWLQHNVKWMWKFHLIHHTDRHVDVTTGLRHHPGENVFRLLFTALAVFITGASFGMVMLYQSLSVFFAHMSHANIKMPATIDKALSTIFVTPHFHKVHHHYVQPHTDSNYGNIFSIWDHVFRTYTKLNKMEDLVYGIDTHLDAKEHSSLKNLMMIPFQKYRAPVGSKFSGQ